MLKKPLNKPDHASFSPAKMIISGEHSVVYGHKAIVSALDVGVYAWLSELEIKQNYSRELRKYVEHVLKVLTTQLKLSETISINQVQIYSEVAIGVGLGSSAAYAHAIILAVLEFFSLKLSKDKIFELVLEAEKYIHGNPSGVDPSAVVYGGVQVFQKNISDGGFSKSELQLARPFSFFLINSGQATETTGEMVESVARQIKQNEKKRQIISDIGKITSECIEQFESGAFTGELLRKNNKKLEQLNLIGERAQEIVNSVESLGFYAKVSGAGGVQSGSGMILCYVPSENYSQLELFCNERSLEFVKSTIK